MNNNKENINDLDEISLKELILKVKDYFSEIFRSWYIVLGLVVLGGVLQYYNYIKSETTFTAEVRFVIEGQGGSGGGGLGGLLGNFGIGNNENLSPYKVLEIGKSSELLKKVISEEQDKDILANSIIKVNGLKDKWDESNSRLKGFEFKEKLIDRELNKEESLALKALSKVVWGSKNIEPMVSFTIDELTGIYSVKTNSKDEDLSYLLAINVFENVKFFFEEDVFQNQQQILDVLSAKQDSLNRLREQKVYELQRFKSRNRSNISAMVSAEEIILNQDQLVIVSTLTEVIKRKAITEISIKDSKPLFMVIDYPFKPLTPSRTSLGGLLFLGIVLGAFFAIVFIVVRKLYREIMFEA